MDITVLGAHVRRLLGKAPRRGERRGSPAGAGPGRPARWTGCGLRGRPPLSPEAELQLYDDMRRSFPILDVAVTRLVQLCGHPRVEGPASAREELQAWMDRLPAGPGQVGAGSWLETHLDHMLVFGRGIGKVVLTRGRRDVYAVLSLDPREVRLELGPDALRVRLLHHPHGALESVELPTELTLLSLHAPQGCPLGTSLLRSLPFAAEACSIIENATAQVWQRMGSPSFHVNWRGGADLADPQGTLAAGVLRDLESSFTELMAARRRGEVRDLFTSGEIHVGILGDGGQLVGLQEPFRVFMEQMVAVTGLPPWMLGLHWSSTERLSVQQADLLVATIEGLRRQVHPQVEALVDLRQRLRGGSSRCRVAWPPVNLRDAAEQARAAAWREQARQRRIENARRMWELGFWSQDRAAREADPEIAVAARTFPEPPGRDRPDTGRLTPAD